jgi:small GTP-binding protein
MAKTDKFDELISNLFNSLEEIQAVAIVDKDGLIIFSKIKGMNKEDEEIGTITTVFESFIERVKKDFGKVTNFVNITLIDENKFLFATAGPKAILTVIADGSISDNTLKVFGSHVSNKIKLIIEGEELIKLDIPPIIRILSKMREGKIPEGNFSVKIIVLGAPGVGKTSLIRRFVDDKFAESYVSTIGVDISRKEVNVSENCIVNESIWDIGGQAQEMAPYRKRFYFGANHAFIVFDITRKSTFDKIQIWRDDLETSNLQLSFILIANKTDLGNPEVTLEQIKQKAADLNCPYLLCSAKSGNNVIDAFRYAAYKFLEQY